MKDTYDFNELSTPIQPQKYEGYRGVEVDNVNNKIGLTEETVTKLTTLKDRVDTNDHNITRIATALEYLETQKQGKLTAGANITIDSNNVISATGGGEGGDVNKAYVDHQDEVIKDYVEDNFVRLDGAQDIVGPKTMKGADFIMSKTRDEYGNHTSIHTDSDDDFLYVSGGAMGPSSGACFMTMYGSKYDGEPIKAGQFTIQTGKYNEYTGRTEFGPKLESKRGNTLYWNDIQLQYKLNAGDGIEIDQATNTIKATGGGGPTKYLQAAEVDATGEILTITNQDGSTVEYKPIENADFVKDVDVATSNQITFNMNKGGTSTFKVNTDGFVTTSSDSSIVYGTDTTGKQRTLSFVSDATPSTLCYRGTDGKVSVGKPTEDAHAANKEYVDGVVSNLQAKLTTEQLEACNSGITEAKVTAYDGYAATIAGKQDKITDTNKLPYNLLKDTPTIPTVPTNVSAFNNDAGYITNSYHDDTKLDSSKITTQYTAPTAAITDGGIHRVFLSAEPTTYYDGYDYYIEET